MKYYDFKPGFDALRRMWSLSLLKYLSRQMVRHKFRFFTDGVGYIDQQIAVDGLFERGLIDYICDVAVENKATDLYVDIGANIGNHVVGVASTFDRIVAFEPHPVLFHVLSANILANNIETAEVHNFGLGLSNDSLTLVENPENHGLSKIEDLSTMSADYFNLNEEAFSQQYKVEIKSADLALEPYYEVLENAFIKIDVEGMEFQIIQALMPILERQKPVLAFEWVPKEQPEMRELLDLLVDYRLFTVSIHQSRFFLLRHLGNMLRGRRYEMRELDFDKLPSLIPLVFAIPKQKG